MRPSQLLAAIVALSSISAAWPDVFENVNALGEVKNVIYGRQDNSESAQPESTAEPRSTEEANTTGEARTTESATETEKPTATGKDDDNKSTGKTSGTAKATGTKSGKPKATNFGADVPAGGISMVTPAAIAGAQYYKVGEWVTFAWNYTSLSVTPSAIDVMASCSLNSATYTIAVNMSTEETGRVLWDTQKYQEEHQNSGPQLLTATYTLLIYDAESSVSATARPGYLAPYNQFTFGMYTPQPYTPWTDYNCATCNSAMSILEKLTLKALLITSCTTIASLLYFAASFGVW